MKKSVKRRARRTNQGKRKTAAIKFSAYSEKWWLVLSHKYDKNPNNYPVYSKWKSLINNSRPSYAGREGLHNEAVKKLMELKEKKKPREILQVVSAFLIKGLDDEIIHCLKKAKLYSFAGHVSLARGHTKAALGWYEIAEDKKGVLRASNLLGKERKQGLNN